MKVKELIELLEPLNPELEVRLVEMLEEPKGDEDPVFHYPNISNVEYDKHVTDEPVILIF